MTAGGVANTAIPNFVYRWKRYEIIKTIQSHAPIADHTYRFFHRFRLPSKQLMRRRNLAWHGLAIVLRPLARLCNVLCPRLGNNFAAAVIKPRIPEDLFPWLQAGDGGIVLNRPWINAKYTSDGSVSET